MFGIVTASSAFSQLSLGLHATGNLSDASIEASDISDFSKKARALPAGGVVADLTLSPGLSLRSGINFLQHGTRLQASLGGVPGEIDDISVESKASFNYLQVPVNLLFTAGKTIQFHAGGGPYLSFAVSGKAKSTTTYKFADGTSQTEEEESDIFEEDENGDASFQRTDYGVGALAGIKLPNGFFANIGYQFSLANLSNSDGEEYKNRGFQLTVGYFLWRK